MNGYDVIDQAIQRFHYYALAPRVAKPSPAKVRQLAASAGLRLPEAFVHFCAAHGAGAFTERVSLALPAACPLGPEFVVDILYTVGAPPDWDALLLRDKTYQGRLPFEAVPISTDAGGNLLLIPTHEDETIYAWDHEHRELDDLALDRIVAELGQAAVPVADYDIDQLILIWEDMFPARVANPSGHGNLYRVADSYIDMFRRLHPATV